jgi:hypothetical protein
MSWLSRARAPLEAEGSSSSSGRPADFGNTTLPQSGSSETSGHLPRGKGSQAGVSSREGASRLLSEEGRKEGRGGCGWRVQQEKEKGPGTGEA